jgi:hypothetical protein
MANKTIWELLELGVPGLLDRLAIADMSGDTPVTNYVEVGNLISSRQPLNSNLSDIAALTSPGSDRLLFWDHSGTAHKYLSLGTNLSITDTTINASGGSSLVTDNGVAITLGIARNSGAFIFNGSQTNNPAIVFTDDNFGQGTLSVYTFNSSGTLANWGVIRASTFVLGAAGLCIKSDGGDQVVKILNDAASAFRDIMVRDYYSFNPNFLMRAFNNAFPAGSTSNVPTLTAGPVTGNPTKWIPVDDNGITRYIPSW